MHDTGKPAGTTHRRAWPVSPGTSSPAHMPRHQVTDRSAGHTEVSRSDRTLPRLTTSAGRPTETRSRKDNCLLSLRSLGKSVCLVV